MLQVVAMDFVAIEPYVSPALICAVVRCLIQPLVQRPHPGRNRYGPHSSVQIPLLMSTGQRYHVIVEARPANDLIAVEDQNYWMRITGADGCLDIEAGQNNEKLGIIRYNSGSTKLPTSTRYRLNTECADEPYESLVPVVPMDVDARERPANDSQFPRFPSPYSTLIKCSTHSRRAHGRQF